MKLQKLVALPLILMSASSVFSEKAFANKEGHGGGAMVCREPSTQKIMSDLHAVELLDLWEATAIYPFQLNRKKKDTLEVEDLIKDVYTKAVSISPDFAASLQDAVVEAYTRTHEVPETEFIPAPVDIFANFGKTIIFGSERIHCNIEGAASYDDKTKVLSVDPRLVDKMQNLDQAALKIHEGVYLLLRKTENATDSIRAREITGYLFSENQFASPIEGLPYINRECKSKNYHFFYYPAVNGQTQLQFLKFGGRRAISRSTVSVPQSMFKTSKTVQYASMQVRMKSDFEIDTDLEVQVDNQGALALRVVNDDSSEFESVTCGP